MKTGCAVKHFGAIVLTVQMSSAPNDDFLG